MFTRESLGIFWGINEKDENGRDSVYQKEVDGMIFYGYWNKKPPEKLFDLDTFEKLWKGSKIQTKLTKWDTENYSCYSIDVYIMTWPSTSYWKENIMNSLSWFCKQGALLSWCGGEDSSPSVDVFNPAVASGNVYAAFTPDIGYICNSALFEEYIELHDYQLDQCRKIMG